MLKILSTIIVPLLLSSCGKEDELITFPPGDYVSDCFVVGSDSKKTEITINRDFKSQTVETFVFAGNTNCNGTGVSEAAPVSNEVLIIFSNVNLGNDFSYLTTTFEESGQPKTEYIAFKFENSRLYFSIAVDSLGTDPKQTFLDFITEPDFTADLILTRKDLNRRLSRN